MIKDEDIDGLNEDVKVSNDHQRMSQFDAPRSVSDQSLFMQGLIQSKADYNVAKVSVRLQENENDIDINVFDEEDTLVDFARAVKVQGVRCSPKRVINFDEQCLPLNLITRKLFDPIKDLGN